MNKENISYSSDFYKSIQSDSLVAAKEIIPILKSTFNPNSVLDVGCGDGTWLKQWGPDLPLCGLEGYHSKELFSEFNHDIHFCDLNQGLPPLMLEKKFGLVTCFEVAEHLKTESAELVVSQICKITDVVCFSSATPGQGGVAHINEKPLSYWKSIYDKNGFNMYDLIRPEIQMDKIAPWYKYNTFVYVRKNSTFETKLKKFLVNADSDIKNFEPNAYRIRKAFLSILPVGVITQMALLKHRLRSKSING